MTFVTPGRMPSAPNGVFSRYLAWLAAFFIGGMLAVLAVNTIVFVRRPPPVEWHNQPFFFRDVREKTPDLVIVGSSRVDAFRIHPYGDPRVVTIDRNRFDWGQEIKTYAVLTLYNGGFSDLELAVEASRALGQAHTVAVGLDFFAANAFFHGSDNYPVDFLRAARVWYMRFASAQEWLSRPFAAADLHPTRYIPPANDTEVFKLAAHRYLRKLFENGNNLNELAYPLTGYSPAIRSLRKMLAAFENGSTSELILFITPTHAWALEAVDLVGRWPEFEAWRRALIAEVDQINARLVPGRRVSMWDFDGHHCIAAQNVPGGSKRFWSDVDHQNVDVARMMVAQMRGQKSPMPAGDCSAQFGTQLSATNIEAHLQRLRDMKADYRRNFPADAEEVRRIYRGDRTFQQKIF